MVHYIDHLNKGLDQAGVGTQQRFLMQSNGGVMPFSAAIAGGRTVHTLFSGPAAGAQACANASSTGSIPSTRPDATPAGDVDSDRSGSASDVEHATPGRGCSAMWAAGALRDAGGGVSHAARLLGFRHHQTFVALLNNRHKDLLHARNPVVPRRRAAPSRSNRAPSR